ncbi:hypothetical protein CRG98_021207 [Punica granatum]|uniref:Uncharacterized protein n=1 Tax=Punica granatum TaxID=22663 RepID=A0A2I0JQ11_PUNGR|nr:hypothetical protein CRG98_021207 [Punica granatum]
MVADSRASRNHEALSLPIPGDVDRLDRFNVQTVDSPTGIVEAVFGLKRAKRLSATSLKVWPKGPLASPSRDGLLSLDFNPSPTC